MEILGIGTDIIECPRIGKMIEQHGELFLRRVYTEREIRYCQARKHAIEHFAGRWAAKEAILKAIGTGWSRGIAWTDIEVRNAARRRAAGPGLRRREGGRPRARDRRHPDLDLALPDLRHAYALAPSAAETVPATVNRRRATPDDGRRLVTIRSSATRKFRMIVDCDT